MAFIVCITTSTFLRLDDFRFVRFYAVRIEEVTLLRLQMLFQHVKIRSVSYNWSIYAGLDREIDIFTVYGSIGVSNEV